MRQIWIVRDLCYDHVLRTIILGASTAVLGGLMSCRACKSENLQVFDSELTLSIADLNGVDVPPVYVCHSVLTCLDCGFVELVVPPKELQALKKAKAARGS
jgi:hypothetical protein